jgi:hypothetical protein
MRRVALVLVVCGCEAAPLPEVSVEGVHVRVAMDAGLTLCGGTIDHMDAFAARAAAELGVAAPTGSERVTFYWLEDDEFVARSGCPHYGLACVRGGEAYSTEAPQNHEIFHVVAGPLGELPRFFTEGLATAYGGLGAESWLPSAVGPTLATIGARSSVAVDYRMAGAFTWFLIEEHGSVGVLAALTGLPWYFVAEEDVDEALRGWLGVTLADSVAAFEAEFAACADGAWMALLSECAGPEIAWDGVAVSEHRALDCAQADAVGPYYADDVVVFRTIEIREAGEYEITVLAEDDVAVSITPCESRCAVPMSVRAGDRWVVELAAGVHSLRLHGRALAPGSIGWSLRRR